MLTWEKLSETPNLRKIALRKARQMQREAVWAALGDRVKIGGQHTIDTVDGIADACRNYAVEGLEDVVDGADLCERLGLTASSMNIPEGLLTEARRIEKLLDAAPYILREEDGVQWHEKDVDTKLMEVAEFSAKGLNEAL